VTGIPGRYQTDKKLKCPPEPTTGGHRAKGAIKGKSHPKAQNGIDIDRIIEDLRRHGDPGIHRMSNGIALYHQYFAQIRQQGVLTEKMGLT
jgi:hypothetical protein